jgi:hypothetical protein
MRVRSADLVNGQVQERRGISRRALRRSRTDIERVLAWIVLLLGVAGSLIASQGGWENIADRTFSASAAVGVVLLQVFLTWVQWSYGDIPWRAYPARLVDACLTLGGWAPLLIGLMTGIAGSVLRTVAGLMDRPLHPMAPAAGGWLILIIAAVWVAWYPEATLLDD